MQVRFAMRFPGFFVGLALSCSLPLGAEDYRLEVVAIPEQYPPDPQATARNFSLQQINNRGEVLFASHWRDGIGLFHSAIHAGLPGGVRTIVEGGDPVSEFPDTVFAAGGELFTQGNFQEAFFNADGEVVFVATVVDTDPSPGTDPPFVNGFWKLDSTGLELLGPAPVFNPNFSYPFPVEGISYSGDGRLQWTDFRGFRIADNGLGYFRGDVGAYGNFRIDPVIISGHFEISRFGLMRLIAEPEGPVPDSPNWVFESIGLLQQAQVGQKNGALVFETTLRGTHTNSNLGQKKRVVYLRREGAFGPVYAEGDPLPELPALPEDRVLRVDIAAADDTGNIVFRAASSARVGIDVRPLGYWKYTTNGLAKVLRFGEEIQTQIGPVRTLTPVGNVFGSVKMGNGNSVFLADFTGAGFTQATRGVFRESTNGFRLIAWGGMNVFGTTFRLAGDVGLRFGSTLILEVNETNEVAFFASFQDGTNTTLLPGIWAENKDGALRRVIAGGQEIRIGLTNRVIRNFGLSALLPVFNDLGMFLANAFFTDNSMAIIRAVPELQEPPRPGQDFYFNGSIDNNWHAGSGTDTNWEDSEKNPQFQPGEAEPGEANAFIDGFNVVLDQKPASIGSLHSRGQVTIRDQLTLNRTSVLDRLFIDAPRGGLTANSVVAITNDLKWRGGTIDGSGRLNAGTLIFTNGGIGNLKVPVYIENDALFTNAGTLLLMDVSLSTSGRFLAESGVITNAGGVTTVENFGDFVKTGPNDFEIHPPFNSYGKVDVQGGLLRLTGGGSFDRDHVTQVASHATFELAGFYILDGGMFTGVGDLQLGTTNDTADLRLTPGSRVLFDVRTNSVHLNRGSIRGAGTIVNSGHFVWHRGLIESDPTNSASFTNLSRLTIGPEAEVRRLAIHFSNGRERMMPYPEVDQRGSLELASEIDNFGNWRISEPAVLSGPSSANFRNAGLMEVVLSNPGTVTLDVSFAQLLSFDEYGGGRGFLGVGDLFRSNPPTVLRLSRPIALLFASFTLRGGGWSVGPNCSLEFPTEVRFIADETIVEVAGGDIPSLRLQQNAGRLLFLNKDYATPGDFENFRGNYSRLILGGTSTFRVNGDFTNRGLVVSRDQSRIVVNGDFINSPGSTLISDGTVTATGTVTLDHVEGSGEIESGHQSSVGFLGETFVGSSPGRLSVLGSATFSNSATLVMELAGTEAGSFDVLSVRSNAALSGTLVVNLVDDFKPGPGDSFPIVQAGSISGQFANAEHGQSITTIDGYGSFVVNYSATAVVLTAYQPAANPPTTAPASLRGSQVVFDTLTFELEGTAGRPYVVESSANLITWAPALTNIIRFSGRSPAELPLSGGAYQFFRARVK